MSKYKNSLFGQSSSHLDNSNSELRLKQKIETVSDHSAGIKSDSRVIPQGRVNGIGDRNEVRNSIIAGSIAGVTSCIIFHPFDVVRTKMQASTKLGAASADTSSTRQFTSTVSSSTSISSNRISSSSGSLAIFSHTIRNGGLRAFYTGIGLPLAAQAMYKSTIFTTNRITKNQLIEFKTKQQLNTGTSSTYKMTVFDHFFCGAISGAVNAMLFVCPVEYARNQLIAQHTRIADGSQSKLTIMNGPFDVVKSTFKTHGILGLWRGAGVTLVRDSIGCGAFFVMYHLGMGYLPSMTGRDSNSIAVKVGSGLCAGLGYWVVSLPLDSLKTLIQTGKASSAPKVVTELVRRDGFLAGISQLYRGMGLAFSRGASSAAVTVTTYTTVYTLCVENFG